jgi:hypothetical protein
LLAPCPKPEPPKSEKRQPVDLRIRT